MFEGPNPPRYLEAFPRMDIVKGHAAACKERVICQFADQLGRVHGLARFGRLTDTHITLEYDIALPYLPRRFSSVDLELVFTPNGVDANRVITRCPLCRERKISLVYCTNWACASCHGLMYRSQAIAKYTRLFEKRNALAAIIKRGRPKGTHHATYNAWRKEHALLVNRLKGVAPHSANSDQVAMIETVWREPEASDGLFFHGTMGRDSPWPTMPAGSTKE